MVMLQKGRRWLSRLSVLNALIGAVLGVAFGVVGWPGLWLVGGTALGALFGTLAECLFRRSGWRLARQLLLLVVVELVLVYYLVFPLANACAITYPSRHPSQVTPADLQLTYEDVTLTAPDGAPLVAWYIPGRHGAAVIGLHGAGANRTQLLYHAEALVQAGYGVLLVELRAHGESGGDRFRLAAMPGDVQAAVAYLQQRPEVDPARIGGLGLSLGAMAMIQAAAETPELRALIADGADAAALHDLLPLSPAYRPLFFLLPEVWVADRYIAWFNGAPVTPLKVSVAQIAPRPLLLISAGQGNEQWLNRHFYEQAGPTATLWELPESSHTQGIMTQHDEYVQRMVAFFDAHLLPAGLARPDRP